MMIDTSPWSSCSCQSPWLPCFGHTISSTGPSVSPFRDFCILMFFFSRYFITTKSTEKSLENPRKTKDIQIWKIDFLGRKKHFLNKSFMSTIEGISLRNLSNGKIVIQIDANSFYMFANFSKLYLKMRHRSHCHIAKLKKVRTKLLAEATKVKFSNTFQFLQCLSPN